MPDHHLTPPPSECRQLDAFLDEQLDENQRRDFGRHLAGCNECAAAVDGARQLDQLLAELSPAAAPEHLISRIQAGLMRQRRRHWLVAAGTAASLLVAATVALVAWPLAQRQSDDAHREVAAEPAVEGLLEQPPPVRWQSFPVPSPLRVTVSEPDAILVEMPSSRSDITIVWVYPTIGPSTNPNEREN